MWAGKETDSTYENLFNLLCEKHEDKKHEIKNKDHTIQILKNTFKFMKTICMSFALETKTPSIHHKHSELFKRWLKEYRLFLNNDIMDYKEDILLIDSITTYVLSLMSKICVICRNISDYEDLKCVCKSLKITNLNPISYDNFCKEIFSGSYYDFTKKNFCDANVTLLDFSFLISYYTFLATFGTNPESFWTHIYDSETSNDFKNKGNEAYDKKEYIKANSLYLKGLQERPYSYHLFGNCAQVALKLKNYLAAEFFCRFALIINPEWCKAYFKLATSLNCQGKIHKAHLCASFGAKQCIDKHCKERDVLKTYEDALKLDCNKCKHDNDSPISCPDASNKISLNENSCDTSNFPSISNEDKMPLSNGIVLQENLNNVPELTDSSDSNSDTTETPVEEPPPFLDDEDINVPPITENGSHDEINSNNEAENKCELANNSELKLSKSDKEDKNENFVELRCSLLPSVEVNEFLLAAYTLFSEQKSIEYLFINPSVYSLFLEKTWNVSEFLNKLDWSALKCCDINVYHDIKRAKPPNNGFVSCNDEPILNFFEDTLPNDIMLEIDDIKSAVVGLPKYKRVPEKEKLLTPNDFLINANENNTKKESTLNDLQDNLGPKLKNQQPVELNVESQNDTNEQCLDYKTLSKFENSITEGTSAVKMGLWSIAQVHFRQAHEIITKVPDLNKKVKEIAVKFAYGYACYKCSTYESTNQSISIFKSIINSEKKGLAPVYFLLGLLFSKLHKFETALEYFKTLSTLTEKDYSVNICDFLDEKTLEQFKFEAIQNCLKEEVSKCECPPPPDAMCRFEKCPYEPAIYVADLAFKKFMCIRCQERCILQYHFSCWKSLKESLNKSDKEFLDSSCFTPDCNGLIIKVETIGKDGILERDFVSESNYKPKKSMKQKKTKLEKKQVQKERKKQVRQRSISETLDVVTSYVENQPEVISEPNTDCQSPVKQRKFSDSIAVAGDEEIKSDLSVNAKPFYVIKKDTPEKEIEKPKQHNHKEKRKQKKSTISIEEFCSGYSENNLNNCSEYQLRLHRLQESKRVVEERDDLWRLQSDANDNSSATHLIPELNNFTENTYGDDLVSNEYSPEDLAKSINLYFENLLQKEGSLPLDSELLQAAINNLSDEAKRYIRTRGGFSNYIQCNNEFAIVNNTLCRFCDMLDFYRRNSFSQGYVADNRLVDADPTVPSDNNLDDFDMELYDKRFIREILDDTLEINNDQNNTIFTSLNPNAEEYNPTKESNSESSNYSQDKKSSEDRLSQSPPDGENAFLSLVESVRPNFKSVLSPKSSSSHSSESETQVLTIPDESVITPQSTTSVKDNLAPEDFFHMHFQNLMEHENKSLLIKSYRSLKFLIQQLEKDCNITRDSEAGSSAVVMVSQGVMKTDEEFEKVCDQYKTLETAHQTVLENMKELQDTLSSSLDKQKELQNKYLIETNTLKEKLEENHSTFVEELKTMKKRQSFLEKEVKSWRQKYEDLSSKEQKLTDENNILQKKIEESESYLKTMEQNATICVTLQREMQLMEDNHKEIIKGYEEQMKEEEITTNKLKSELQLALLRAKQSELRVLEMISEAHNKNFMKHQGETNQNIQNLQFLLNNPNFSSLAPSMKLFQTNLRTMMQEVKATHSKFMMDVMSHKASIESGKPLSQLTPLVVPKLPPITPLEALIPQYIPNLVPNNNLLSGLISPNGNSLSALFPNQSTPGTNFHQNTIKENPGSQSHSLNSLSSFSVNALESTVAGKVIGEPPPGLTSPSLTNSTSVSRTASVLSLDTQFNDSALELDYTGAKTALPSDSSSMKPKKSKGIGHILNSLKNDFPSKDEATLMLAIDEYRRMKGRLSNLPVATIISGIKEIIIRNESKPLASHINVARPKTLINKSLTSCSAPVPPPLPKSGPSVPPWATLDKSVNNFKHQNFEKVCAICLEDMRPHSVYTIECNHNFHKDCIQKWVNKQSNCPICRVHVLLPEDFPSL